LSRRAVVHGSGRSGEYENRQIARNSQGPDCKLKNEEVHNMSEGFVSRGFGGRRSNRQDAALPPGQYLVGGFPVLSAGPTPHTPLEE
jgi:hypothetical protein